MYYLTRRQFLAAIAAGIVSADRMRLFSPRFVFADGPTGGPRRNLVVIRLSGGIDALEAFPYIGNSGHAAAIRQRRPRIATPATSGIVDSASQLAFHDGWAPIVQDFGSSGSLRLIFGFGNHTPGLPLNLSHDFNSAMQAIGTPYFNSQSSGWLARSMEAFSLSPDQVLGIGIPNSTEFRTDRADLHPYVANSLANLSHATLPDTLGGAAEAETIFATARLLRGAHQRAHPDSDTVQKLVSSLNRMDDTANFFSEVNAFERPGRFMNYTPSNLGESLKGIAKTIASLDSEGRSRLFLTGYNHSEWDSHDNQSTALSGHIGDLALNLASFAADLRALPGDLWARTTVITISEFGRRVYDNGRGGTDHGTGTVALAYGGGVQSGVVLNPELPNYDWSRAEYYPVSVHFQNLLAQSLSWMGFDASQIFESNTYATQNLQLFRS